MVFTIEFYETSSGRYPVREFLDELKESNPNDFAAIMAGLAKLRSKATKIAARDRRVALDRKRDWLTRNPL
jgi:hypothetical protein